MLYDAKPYSKRKKQTIAPFIRGKMVKSNDIITQLQQDCVNVCPTIRMIWKFMYNRVVMDIAPRLIERENQLLQFDTATTNAIMQVHYKAERALQAAWREVWPHHMTHPLLKWIGLMKTAVSHREPTAHWRYRRDFDRNLRQEQA